MKKHPTYFHFGRIMLGVFIDPRDWMLKFTKWTNRLDFEIGPFQLWINIAPVRPQK